MSEIVKGARVRVTFEGTAKNVDSERFDLAPSDVRQNYVRVTTRAPMINVASHVPVEIEVLAPPKPQYKVGEVYRGDNGCDYVRDHTGWRLILNDHLSPCSGDSKYEGMSFVKLIPETS